MAWRELGTKVGLGALGLVVAGAVVFAYANASGVHCPQCDRPHLSDAAYQWRVGHSVDAMAQTP